MKPCACVVWQNNNHFSVSLGDEKAIDIGPASTDPDDVALAVLDFLQRENKLAAAKDNIIFCPDSQLVLFAKGECSLVSKKPDHSQLKFAAETFLPLDAEHMAADFINHDGALRVLAIDHDDILPFVEAFHQQRMHFRWILPAPLLAIEEASKAYDCNDQVILWEEEEHCDLWRLDQHGPTHWHHIVGGPKQREAAIRLFAARTDSSDSWTLFNSKPETTQLVQAIVTSNVNARTTDSQAEWLTKAANRLCKGTNTAWFDLRDGVIAGEDRYRALHGLMAMAALSVFFLLAALPFACWWKSQSVSRSIAAMEQAESDLFTGYFKNQTIPDDITISDFIAQKHHEAKGSRNMSGGVENTISALEVMHVALNAVKQQSDFTINSITIDKGKLDLDINLKDLSAVSELTNRLQNLGLDVKQPNSDAGPNNTRSAIFTGSLKRDLIISNPSSSVSLFPDSLEKNPF
jgi:hypothetical protein